MNNKEIQSIKNLISKNNDLKKSTGLGRGLSALLGNNINNDSNKNNNVTNRVIEININNVKPGKYQPRSNFKDDKLNELSLSIKQKGVLQPILVRRNKNSTDQYEIVAGERRWRACKLAELNTIPSIIVDFSDKESLEIGLIENLQRQNLNPMEEAKAFEKLIKEFNYTHNDLAKAIGKDRSYITNYLRVLTLSEEVQELVELGKLSIGHAKVIVNHEYPMEIAEKVIQENLSVRDTEKIVKNIKNRIDIRNSNISEELVSLKKLALEKVESIFKGYRSEIKLNNNGSGYIKIKIKDKSSLEKIIN